MNVKSYLKGIGVGIIVTSLILIIAGNMNNRMSDADVIKRAKEAGISLKIDDSFIESVCKNCNDSARQIKRKIQQKAEELLTFDLTEQKEKTEVILTFAGGKACLKTFSRK